MQPEPMQQRLRRESAATRRDAGGRETERGRAHWTAVAVGRGPRKARNESATTGRDIAEGWTSEISLLFIGSCSAHDSESLRVERQRRGADRATVPAAGGGRDRVGTDCLSGVLGAGGGGVSTRTGRRFLSWWRLRRSVVVWEGGVGGRSGRRGAGSGGVLCVGAAVDVSGGCGCGDERDIALGDDSGAGVGFLGKHPGAVGAHVLRRTVDRGRVAREFRGDIRAAGGGTGQRFSQHHRAECVVAAGAAIVGHGAGSHDGGGNRCVSGHFQQQRARWRPSTQQRWCNGSAAAWAGCRHVRFSCRIVDGGMAGQHRDAPASTEQQQQHCRRCRRRPHGITVAEARQCRSAVALARHSAPASGDLHRPGGAHRGDSVRRPRRGDPRHRTRHHRVPDAAVGHARTGVATARHRAGRRRHGLPSVCAPRRRARLRRIDRNVCAAGRRLHPGVLHAPQSVDTAGEHEWHGATVPVAGHVSSVDRNRTATCRTSIGNNQQCECCPQAPCTTNPFAPAAYHAARVGGRRSAGGGCHRAIAVHHYQRFISGVGAARVPRARLQRDRRGGIRW
eukprot:ctg_2728.g456